MSTNNSILDKLMKNPVIRSAGLKREFILNILDAYHEILMSELLDKGSITIGNGVHVEVVQLTNRIHVLRGVTYQGHRSYKLKTTMDDVVYKRIEEYYDKLKEEIL